MSCIVGFKVQLQPSFTAGIVKLSSAGTAKASAARSGSHFTGSHDRAIGVCAYSHFVTHANQER
jgi:hypothetical protein